MEKSRPTSSAWSDTWRQDLLASLVVFLVALPLCMGIALASGAPVAAGLVTGIIGGLVVGFLAGAPLQVSGPAAGLTVICAEVIREHGLAALGLVVLVAGVLQLVAGLLKFGQWFRAVSPAVIRGMLSGIGVLILAGQIHVMVDDRPQGSGLANLRSIPAAIAKGLPLPAWEPVEHRQARLAFLQRLGQLHERQSEIAALVSRTATHHGSAALHAEESHALARFAPAQQELVFDFATTAKELAQSSIASPADERAESLLATVATARRNLACALADLKASRVQQANDSQGAAVTALADVLASLKSHDWAAKVGLLSILIIVLWQGFAPQLLRLIPGPLLAIVLTTAAAWALSLPVLYVEVPAQLIDGLAFPSPGVLADLPLRQLLTSGLVMAAIASAETLLCASAVDRMHTGPRTQYDRELAAQGVGNILCGLLGALPMTGVIVRSAANVQAGGKTNLSAILHGLWLLVFVVVLGAMLRIIPTAALAGILVYTGFKLIDWKGLWSLWNQSRSEAAIFVVTLVVIVVEDLLTGVVTGVVLSAVKLLVTFSHLEAELTPPATGKSRHERVRLTLSGAATFLRLPQLAARLDEVPPGGELHVDLQRLDYIDHACLDLLMNWARQHESAGGRLVIDWGRLHGRFSERHRSPQHQHSATDGRDHDNASESAA